MAGPKVGPAVAANVDPATKDVPVGGYVCSSAAIAFDADRPVTTLKVRNAGDRRDDGDGFGIIELETFGPSL